MSKALLVIDLQNDYFPGGLFPLWNADAVLQNVEKAIERATTKGIPVIHIQHVADSKMGIARSSTRGRPGSRSTPASWPLRPMLP